MSGRIVLVEGLPGSGKSTLAHLLARHLARSGMAARWHYEHAGDHPIHDADAMARMVRGESWEPAIFEESVERWRNLALGVAERGEVVILESAVFQPPVHLLLLAGVEVPAIRAWLERVTEAIATARPTLVHIRPPDLDRALEEACRIRGGWFAGFLEERIRRSPYGRARSLAGSEGVLAYFRDYHAFTMELAGALPFPVLPLKPRGESAFERLASVCARLGLEVPVAPEVAARDEAPSLVGAYRAPGTDQEMRIARDEDGLCLAGDAPARLLPGPDGDLEVLGTCVTVRGIVEDGGVVALACRAPISGLPPRWERVAGS